MNNISPLGLGFAAWVTVGAVLLGALHWWHQRPVVHGPGMVAPNEPSQSSIDAESMRHKGYTITRLAEFAIDARVLAVEHYWLDSVADLSPVDLALGWGPMSDESTLAYMDIDQGGRWYTWRIEAPSRIPRETVVKHSANMHIVPASTWVERQLDSLREGQVVSIRGYLIKAEKATMRPWVSSLTRDDAGDGACEIVWVEQLETLAG